MADNGDMSTGTPKTAVRTEETKQEALKKLTELREQIRKRIGTVDLIVPIIRAHRDDGR